MTMKKAIPVENMDAEATLAAADAEAFSEHLKERMREKHVVVITKAHLMMVYSLTLLMTEGSH